MGLVFPTSVVEPLLKKVKTFKTHVNEVLTNLKNGDPEAKKQVVSLKKDISNFMQDGQSTYAQLLQAGNNATATQVGSKIPGNMVVMIIFYLRELKLAYDLVRAIQQLIVSVLSISTILAYIAADLKAMQQWLNTKLLWLKRALARIQQRIAKELEWLKRAITANFHLLYLKGQQKVYTVVLEQLKANLPPKAPPIDGTNGEYINGVFAYYDAPLNSSITNALAGNSTIGGTANTLATSSVAAANTAAASVAANAGNAATNAGNAAIDEIASQIIALQAQLVSIAADLKNAQEELDKFIPADKKYWKALWEKQAAQDQADLLNNFPTPGH